MAVAAATAGSLVEGRSSAHSLVLLPGLDGTGDLFAPLLEVLPQDLRPVIIRYRSGATPEPAELAAEIPRGSLVVAESFSGPIAIRLLAARPELASRLVLCNSFVSSPMPWWAAALPLRLVLSVRLPRWCIRRYLVGADAADPLVARVGQVIGSVAPALLARRLRTLDPRDAAAALPSLALPILYLRGQDDRLVGERYVQEITTLRPDLRLARLPGPHFLLQARPRECWGIIRAFGDHH
jgi:pimeloyl-ACP methyl ester carboxylesterase